MSVGKISSAPNFEDFCGDQELDQSSQSEEENILGSFKHWKEGSYFQFLERWGSQQKARLLPG